MSNKFVFVGNHSHLVRVDLIALTFTNQYRNHYCYMYCLCIDIAWLGLLRTSNQIVVV